MIKKIAVISLLLIGQQTFASTSTTTKVDHTPKHYSYGSQPFYTLHSYNIYNDSPVTQKVAVCNFIETCPEFPSKKTHTECWDVIINSHETKSDTMQMLFDPHYQSTGWCSFGATTTINGFEETYSHDNDRFQIQ